MRDSKEPNHQAPASVSTDSALSPAAVGQESATQRSDVSMSNRIGGTPGEPRVEAALDPQTKLPVEKRMLTSLTGSDKAPAIPQEILRLRSNRHNFK